MAVYLANKLVDRWVNESAHEMAEKLECRKVEWMVGCLADASAIVEAAMMALSMGWSLDAMKVALMEMLKVDDVAALWVNNSVDSWG